MVASEKGVVVGRLSFREDGDPIDCARMGVGGKAIPPNIDKVGCTPRTACQLHALRIPVLWVPVLMGACAVWLLVHASHMGEPVLGPQAG